MTEELNLKIGIIGGSGFSKMDELKDPQKAEFRRKKAGEGKGDGQEKKAIEGTEDKNLTDFGKPSDYLYQGKINDVDCVVLARHGPKHLIQPTEVNFQANIWAMKELGVTHILALTACGSLKEKLHPEDLVVLDSFIDRTTKRAQSFYSTNAPLTDYRYVCHIPMYPTFCEATRNAILAAAEKMEDFEVTENKGSEVAAENGKELESNAEVKDKDSKNDKKKVYKTGTIVTIEGPRFSTRAESNMFRQFGADVINMTTVPEVVLAKEAGISYASVAMVTDYDCWKVDAEPVNIETVLKVLCNNVSTVQELFVNTIDEIKNSDWKSVVKANRETAAKSVMKF